MVNWEEYSETQDDRNWDSILLTAKDYTIFQSFAWGEYKESSNWVPLRYWMRDKNNNVLAMVQLLLKKLPFSVKIIWAAGGPVFQFPSSRESKLTEYVESLVTLIHKRYPRSIVRFHSNLPNNSNLAYSLNKVCLRPFYKINSGYSISMDLDVNGETLRKQMTSKHRYYAKKASASPIHWKVGNSDNDLREFSKIYKEVIDNKNLAVGLKSYEDLISMRNFLKDGVVVLTGYINDKPITACLVLLFGHKAYYLLAATGEQGRAISASYAMFEKLAYELKERGATNFDFGGIDPASTSAVGVDHFKRGFGGHIQEYLGEWESVNSSLLRLGVNIAIRSIGGHV